MRLIDIKEYINIAFENFKYTVRNSNGVYYIDNIQQLKVSLECLVKAGFVDEKEKFIDTVLYTSSNTLSSDSGEYNRRIDLLNDILFLLQSLHKWINKYVLSEQDEKTINIKLPQIGDLERLAEVSSLLEKSLSVIVYVNGGEPIKVKQLDHGSFWVVISVCSVQIVKAIAKAANFAVELAQKIVELKKSIALLERLSIENQAMDNLLKLQECAIKKLIQEKAMEMNSELPENPDSNERVKRLEKSIKELVDLITDGAEFHAALTASSEIINEFPDFNKINYLKNSVGVLSENKDTKDEVEQN